MASHSSIPEHPPERFVVEVYSELDRQLVQERWHDVNVILRLSMLSGLELHPDSTFNLLCDLACEVASCDGMLVFFDGEDGAAPRLRVARNFENVPQDALAHGNILNLWATRTGRPLLITPGRHEPADQLLDSLAAASALVVPLFARNRVVGSLQLFRRHTAPFLPADAQLLWILTLVAENLVTREFSNDGLIRFAFTDYLTGLKTRGYFEQQLDLEIKRSERRREPLSLLMIDIDFFKPLNDRYGHHVGDQILRDVAALLMKDMREVDTVARYGGEEFVIILPETGGSGAQLVANRLRGTVEQARFFAGTPDTIERVTISIGIAVFGADVQLKRNLIESADAALYAAKHNGRNRVLLFSELARPAAS